MVFPVVAASSGATDAGSVTHNVLIPPCAIGDVMMIWAGIDNSGGGGNTTVDDFDRFITGSEGAGVAFAFLGRRAVTGAETWFNGGAGGNTIMRHALAAACAYAVVRVTGADPGASGPATLAVTNARLAVADANPDPPLLTPTWPQSDTLWMTAYQQSDGTLSTLGFPAGYAALQQQAIGTAIAGVHHAIAQKSVNAASDNPGAFTSSGGGAGWVAVTFAMRAPVSSSSAQGFVPRRRFGRIG